MLYTSPPSNFQTFLRPCEGYCCCHGLIMQNHGPWCKEEEKGSLVKNQSEFMHLWPWMEILTTGGAKRDENYTLPCYYVRERSIHKSILIWFWFIDHTYVIHNTINNCQHIFVTISFFLVHEKVDVNHLIEVYGCPLLGYNWSKALQFLFHLVAANCICESWIFFLFAIPTGSH